MPGYAAPAALPRVSGAARCDVSACCAGAHNTIVTSRAGKDLVSCLVSGLLTIGPRFGGAIDDAARFFQVCPFQLAEPPPSSLCMHRFYRGCLVSLRLELGVCGGENWGPSTLVIVTAVCAGCL